MNNITLSRKGLYDLVWSQPMSNIVKKYNVSTEEMKKHCQRLNIPTPETGYWQKLQYGKEVKQIELPEDISVEQDIILTIRDTVNNSLKPLSPLEIRKQEIEDDSNVNLIVPERLVAPHELIKKAQDQLLEKDKYSNKYDIVNSYGYDRIYICVTRDKVRRALLFMDTVIKAFISRGFEIDVNEEFRRTRLIKDEEEVEIHCREKTKRIVVTDDRNWTHSEYQPVGLLTFKARIVYTDFEWTDGRSKVEEQISKIIAKIELHVEERFRWKLEREKDAAIQREKDEIIRLQEKCKKKELDDFKKLVATANRWHQTEIIKNYLNAIEAQSIKNNTYTEELKSQIEWSRKKVDWYDPLIDAKDELLDHINKDSI